MDNTPQDDIINKRREKQREYYAKNRVRILENGKEYYKKHKEKIDEYYRNYYQKNKEKINKQHSERRAKKESVIKILKAKDYDLNEIIDKKKIIPKRKKQKTKNDYRNVELPVEFVINFND